MQLKYKIKFDGGDADQHRLEAYPAAQSLEGLSWALAITLHYGITGDLRERGDLSRSAKLYISPPKRGSFINELNVFVLENPFLMATAGAYTVGTITPYLNGLIKYVFNQAIGEGGEFPTGAKRMLRRLRGDDLDKLISRIEPPLTRAHAVIGKTADTVTFQSKRTELVTLDEETKAYLEAKPTGSFETLDTNVTSFNLLTGNGRVFDSDQHETAAFSLGTSAEPGTRNLLIKSMEQYDLGRSGTIRITVERVETVAQRLRKFIVSAAEEIPTQEWVDGVDPMRIRR